MYLCVCFGLCWVFVVGFSLVGLRRGSSLVGVHGLLIVVASLALLPGSQAPGQVGFSRCSVWAWSLWPAGCQHRLSSGTLAWLLQCMWDLRRLRDQTSISFSAGRFLTTEPLGKAPQTSFLTLTWVASFLVFPFLHKRHLGSPLLEILPLNYRGEAL